MTKKELFEEYAGIVYMGFDKPIEEQNKRMAEIIQEVEALVRKETIKDILGIKNAYHVRIEKIKEYAQSKGITL